MAFVKKTWVDRLSEFPGRRLLKRISGSADGEMVADVERSEGTVSRAGDAFSAANMNDMEQRIADGFEEVNNDLVSDVYIGTDEKIHVVKGGADTALPFNNDFNGVKMYYYKKNSDSSAYLNKNDNITTGYYNYGADFDPGSRKTTIKFPGKYSIMISDVNGYAACYLNDKQIEVAGHSSKYFTRDLNKGDVLFFTGSETGASAYIEKISD